MIYFPPNIHIESTVLPAYKKEEIQRKLKYFASKICPTYDVLLYSASLTVPYYVDLEFVSSEPGIISKRKLTYRVSTYELDNVVRLKEMAHMIAKELITGYTSYMPSYLPHGLPLTPNDYSDKNKSKKLLLL